MGASITSAAFVLAVPDAEASARWWVDVLGFELTLAIEGWRFVRRDGCEVRLGSCPDAAPAADTGDHSYFAYLVFDDVDAFDAELGPAVDRLFAAVDRPWGMRELGLRTPDGHRLVLAQSVD